MRPVCLIPKCMDDYVFKYDMELGRINNDVRPDHLYVRQFTTVQAAPEVTWKDIIQEFETNQNNPQHILNTTAFICHRYLLYLTVESFFRIATRRPQRSDLPYPSDYEMLVTLAKEMIAYRDFEAVGGYDKNPSKTYMDFLPKD